MGELQQDRASTPATKDPVLASRIAGIWCEILGLEAIATEADFFELGGDSLAAVHEAKEFITGAIEHSLEVGRGHGPVNPMFKIVG